MEDAPRRSEDVLHEHEFLEKLTHIIATHDERRAEEGMALRYESPAWSLVANVFQVWVNERRIYAVLSQRSPSNLRDGALTLSLPDEETAQYYWIEDELGEMCLSVVFPFCNHNFFQDVDLAQIALATSMQALDYAVKRSRLQ